MAESHDCGSTTPVFTAKKRTSSSDLGVTADDSLRSSTSETADQNPSFLDLGIADVLLDAWPLVVQRVNKGRKLAEVLQSCMKERAKLEESYADGLEKLVSRFSGVPPTESSGIRDAVAAFMRDAQHSSLRCVFLVNVYRRAEQSRELAQSFRSDIVESTLSSTIQNHYTVLNQISMDGNHISEMLRQALQRVAETEKQLVNLGRETLALCYECQRAPAGSEASSSRQTQLASKTLTRVQEFHILEQRYARQIQITNDAQNLYQSQMRIILKSLEDMDRKRLSCFKDALRKFMVYQISALRNLQYDADLTSIESLDEHSEIQEFIRRAKADLASRLQKASSNVPDTLQLQPKHWTELCLVPRVPQNLHTLGASPTDHLRLPPSLSAVETATSAARNLLKNTTFDRVVQTAVAQLASIRLSPAEPTEGLMTNQQPIIRESAASSLDADPTLRPSVLDVMKRLCIPDILEAGVRRSPDKNGSNGTPKKKDQSMVWRQLKLYYSREVFDLIWNFTEHNAKHLFDCVLKLKDDVAASSLNRMVVVDVLDAYRRRELFELPNIDALHILGAITDALLEAADRQWDVATGRAIMVLCQKFFAYGTVMDDPQALKAPWVWPHLRNTVAAAKEGAPTVLKENASSDAVLTLAEPEPTCSAESQSLPSPRIHWFLHRIVYHFVIWNRVHFWEEALVLTISEEQQRLLIRDAEDAVSRLLGQAADSSTRPTEENQTASSIQSPSSSLTDGLLLKFASSMLAFGITESQVVSLIQKVCLHHQLSPEFTLRLLRCLSKKQTPVTAEAPSTSPAAVQNAIHLPLAPLVSNRPPSPRVCDRTSTESSLPCATTASSETKNKSATPVVEISTSQEGQTQ